MRNFFVKVILLNLLVGVSSSLSSTPVDTLYKTIYYMNDFDSINALLPEYQNQATDKQLGKLYFLMGWKYKESGNLAKSFDYYNLSRKAYYKIGDLHKEQKCLESLGALALENNLYEKANKYYMEALKVNEESGNKKEIAISLRDVSITLSKIPKSMPEALRYLFRSAKILEEIEEYELLSETLIEIGVIYKELGSYDNALDYYYMAVRNSPDSDRIRAMALNNHSAVLRLKGEFNEAIRKLDSAIKIKKKIGDLDLMVSSLNNLGIIHYKQGNYEKAYQTFLESFRINMDKDLEQNNYQNLYIAYSYMDSICLSTNQEYLLVDNGIFRAYRAKESELVGNIQKYQEKDLTFQAELMKEREVLAEQKKLGVWVFISGAFLAVVAILFIIYYYRDKKKRNALIDVGLQDIKARLEKYM